MPVIRITDIHDDRLAPFLSVGDAELRRREGVFLAEGRLVVRRLLASPRYDVSAVLVTDAGLSAVADVAARRPDVRLYVVPLAWMEPVTGFNLHRGCIAVALRPAKREWTTLLDGHRLLVLEGIGNPDNVGGLFRTAHALGVDAVLLGPGTGDPFYRKALRVSCGAVLSVPFARIECAVSTIGVLLRDGVEVWALTPAPDATALVDACKELPKRLALVVGAESPGLSQDVLALATRRVRIPIRAEADSLNVTVAAGIALASTAAPQHRSTVAP